MRRTASNTASANATRTMLSPNVRSGRAGARLHVDDQHRWLVDRRLGDDSTNRIDDRGHPGRRRAHDETTRLDGAHGSRTQLLT
jgi:hypothetical protein